MNAKPGTYGLVLQADTDTVVQVGRWGAIDIRPGYYIYIGSAFGAGGVLARVSRHCRKKGSVNYLAHFFFGDGSGCYSGC
ncbi:MAG: DUF123 domain-containing protein [Candidatus Thiodiazotropha endolucinida]|nr:DUF123 domain-containing protein [Candidatus Thiodiazotropha endolucinida]